MISTISHDLQASNGLITQKWVGRLGMDIKRPIKKLFRVLTGLHLTLKKLYTTTKLYTTFHVKARRMIINCNRPTQKQVGRPLTRDKNTPEINNIPRLSFSPSNSQDHKGVLFRQWPRTFGQRLRFVNGSQALHNPWGDIRKQ